MTTKGQVLIVESDPEATAALREALRPAGYAVDAVRSAADALRGDGAWDLAFVALALPDGDGLALLAALLARRPRLHVVVLTPRGGAARGSAARAAGAYAFLVVPEDLTPEKILTVAANALERRDLLERLARRDGSPAAPTASAGPAALNLEARERQTILHALETTGWNKQAAAVLLGLHRPTLYSKMRKHGIPQKRPADAAPGRLQGRRSL